VPETIRPGGQSTSRRIYVDAVDEALRNADGKPRIGAKLPRRRLGDIAMKQMRLVEKQ